MLIFPRLYLFMMAQRGGAGYHVIFFHDFENVGECIATKLNKGVGRMAEQFSGEVWILDNASNVTIKLDGNSACRCLNGR